MELISHPMKCKHDKKNLQKVKQHSKSQKELKTMNIYQMKETQTYLMRKKETSFRNSNISDEEEGNFIKKLKKGYGKYKWKLPLKCFNCGKIGHFASKFPYPEEKDSDDEEDNNHIWLQQ
jgi:hypothetical protein